MTINSDRSACMTSFHCFALYSLIPQLMKTCWKVHYMILYKLCQASSVDSQSQLTFINAYCQAIS